MYLERQIKLISHIFKAYILKLKLTRHGYLEVFLKKDSQLPFFFNFFFSILLKDCRLFFASSFVDLAVVDYPHRRDRFDVVYNFLSIRNYFRIIFIIKTAAPFITDSLENTLQFYVKSLSPIFSSAYWLERECWDLYGVFFQDNSDLRRILTDYGFEGYPLRKDFPLTGFLEVRYDDEQRSVVYENLELTQEFRFFDFESPWVLEDKYK